MSPRKSKDAAPDAVLAGDGVPLENYEIMEVHRSKLKGAEYNPRILSVAARQKLKTGIKKLGLIGPPIWNKRTGNIVGGHQRVSIMDSLKGTEDYTLKVAVVDFDDVREKEANLLLNNPEAQGEWDLEKLEEMLHTDGIEISATGFDVADVYRLFGDAPMQTQDLDELAQRLESSRRSYEEIQQTSQTRDENDFYIVVVFRDTADRDGFLKGLGLDENRFQDGRRLRALLTEGAPAVQTSAPEAEAEPHTRREIDKLREVARHFLETAKCSMCSKSLLPVTAFIGSEAGRSRGKALPEVVDITEHHIDGDHENNAPSNREYVHFTCHKRWHATHDRRST